jgi:16S rRNA (guanine966-N2)-methyltransferase
MKSNLQIISGKYRGKKLFLPIDARPTQNLARGALFNMLNSVLTSRQHVTVWDAFTGSGAFGLECLSRLNDINVIFTDNSKTSIDTIRRNLSSINESAKIEMVDAISVIQKYGAISDLIFIDPPYPDFNLGVLFVKKLTKIAKNGTFLIWEVEKTNSIPKIDDNWKILKDKTYGRARFLIMQKV